MAAENPKRETSSILIYASEYAERLDTFVARTLTHLSRTRVQALIEQGLILVNQRTAKASARLTRGDSVLVQEQPEEVTLPTINEHLPTLDVIFEDEQILVVNKPAGMVVHPAPGHEHGTLVDALLAYYPALAHTTTPMAQYRPGIVHRLDKDTSGLLIVAKTPTAMLRLTEQFQSHTITKRYLALVEGHLPVTEGAIEAPVGRDPRHRQRMAITAQHGRQAETLFWTEQEFSRFTLLRIQIVTGRTHQIRVHFAAIGHPIAGDQTYGHLQPPAPPRLFLHAGALQLAHPTTSQPLTFTAPLPTDLQDFLATLQTRQAEPGL
jgi:23S rRNA pseudouridine1911/1915/1917 synthase